MKDENLKRAFAPLHASEETMKEVIRMIDRRERAPSGRRMRRVVFAALLLIAALVVSGFTADYILNDRQVFFFDTLEALLARQAAELPADTAASMAVPAARSENADIETPADYVIRAMGAGTFDGERVLSDETNENPDIPWERRRISEAEDTYYGDITLERRTGAAYGGRVTVEDLLDWDLTPLAAWMTPDTDGQILTLLYEQGETAPFQVAATLGYHGGEGERLVLNYEYDRDNRWGDTATYTLNSAYDYAGSYITADRVEVRITAYDGQVWADASHGGRTVSIYATGYTVEEMETVLDQLSLAAVVEE